jgi:hypothetical protein
VPDGSFIVFDERPSDSPLVERVWRCHSERAGRFLSVAATQSEICVTRLRGKVYITLRGPEMHATTANCPGEGEWFAIRFKLGTFLPKLPPAMLCNRRDVNLPDAGIRRFWLDGSAWHYPDFGNAEEFVRRLWKSGVIVRDPIVTEVLQEAPPTLSLRSAQRHFLRATGMTYASFRQIERARYATNLLRHGTSILDAVHMAGYADQAHLTRSLRHYIGETPFADPPLRAAVVVFVQERPASLNL